MKYKKYFLPAGIAIVLISIAGYFLLGSSSNKKATYTVADWVVEIPKNLYTWETISGWGKMVIYHDSLFRTWKLNSNGDTVWTKKIVSDTCYLIRVDSNNVPNFSLNWLNGIPVLKNVVHPILPIPLEHLARSYAYLPLPTRSDTTNYYRLNNIPLYNQVHKPAPTAQDTANHTQPPKR